MEAGAVLCFITACKASAGADKNDGGVAAFHFDLSLCSSQEEHGLLFFFFAKPRTINMVYNEEEMLTKTVWAERIYYFKES